MRRLAVFAIIPVVLIAGCGSKSNSSSGSTTGQSAASVPAAPQKGVDLALPGEPQGTLTFTGLARNHVDTPVEYPQSPPVGGNHNPLWQNCQYYDTPVP